MSRGGIEFKAGLAGVAGAGDQHRLAGHQAFIKVVIGDPGEVGHGQAGQNRIRRRPLQRQLGEVAADIVQLHPGIAAIGQHLLHPGEVLGGVGGVDAAEVMVLVEAIEGQIVDHPAVRVAHGGVLHLAVGQLGDIVGGQPLEKSQSSGPLDLNLPHVGDIEQPGGVANRQMLFDHPPILDRHLPAAEGDHAPPQATVMFIQRRFFQHHSPPSPALLGLQSTARISGMRPSCPRVIRCTP